MRREQVCHGVSALTMPSRSPWAFEADITIGLRMPTTGQKGLPLRHGGGYVRVLYLGLGSAGSSPTGGVDVRCLTPPVVMSDGPAWWIMPRRSLTSYASRVRIRECEKMEREIPILGRWQGVI